MKIKFAALITILYAIVSCNMPIDESSAVMIIDRHTTSGDLASMVASLGRQNITVKIDEATYLDNGHLRSIAGHVAFPDEGEVTFRSDKVSKIVVWKEGERNNESFGVRVRNKWF